MPQENRGEQPSQHPRDTTETGGGTGISNRKSAEQEANERRKHPPANAGSPPAEDASGRVGDEPIGDTEGRQTSHKAGSRSVAQKEDASRYPDRSMPATHKVGGAFGREPDEGV
jgi:hypothetical protein